MISPAQRRLLLLTATFALSLLSCGREVTGPENGLNYGRARFGAVALSPQMPSLLASLEGASDVVPFERVRVMLRRTDGAIAVDTTVNFPSGVDSIELALLVPLPIDTPQEGLPLSLTMAYINAVGDTVFRGGPVGVVAPPVGSNITPQPILIPIVYDGVGKDAARVAISPDTGTRVAGSISTFTATAFDGQNAPIANTPILFYTLDSSRASIPEAGSGQVTWLPNRGVARIVAALPNGARADTAFVTVALPASKLVVQSGNAQSSAVGTALAQPIVLRTLASDDVPVAGVIVSFAVTSGAGALTVLTDTSDANGEVSTNWTLGGTLGAQSMTATSTGLTGSPLTLTATATAGAPARVVFTQVVTQAVAGVVLAPPVLVEVQDVAGNLVTSFTGPVLLTVTPESASGINGTTQQNAVGGIATFADISFDLVGAHNIVAILDSTARDTSAVINVAPGAATRLEFVAQPSGALAGIPFAPPVTVVAKDLMGNNATGFTGTVTLSLLNPAGATLGGSVAVAAVNGLATFSSLTVDKVGSAYVVAAASGALTPDSSATFAILPALPSGIVPIAGDGQTGPAGVALPTEIVVEVRDSFGNAVPDVTVNFVVELGGGSSSTTAAQTDALGRATTTWTLGPVVGAQTLRASAQGFPLATAVVGAVATVGAPTSVTFVQSPVTPQTAGVAFTPDVVIEVRDNGGNVVTNYNGPVTLGIANNPSGATLLGTLTVNAANGVATFPNILVQIAGVGFTLQATTDTLPPAISGAFDVVNATASVVTPVAGDGQAGIAGTLLADSLVVRVTDAFGNKVTGAQVIFTIDVGGGSIAPSTVITNALGEATSGWTLGTTVGTQNVTASIAGGANYQFSALADVGAPTAITIVSGNGQTGGAGTFLPTPIVVRVADAFNNPVPLTLVNFAIQTGGGSLTATSALTDASGQAQTFTTLGGVLGTQTILASIAGEISVLVTTNVVAGPAAAFTIVAGNNQTGAAGTPVSDTLRVRVADSFGNPLVNYRTEWTIQAGASVLADTLVFTDANGVASNTAVYGALTGPQLLATVVTPNVGSQLGFDAVITAGAATSFEFLVEPAGPVVAGATIANIVVRGLDAFSNPGATFDSVSIVRNSGPGSATLSGTTTRASVGGIATFDDLSLDAAGTYSFRAERIGITPAVSGPLEVTAGAATTMTLVSGDNQIAAAGALYPQPMRVRVTDAFGNGVSNVQVAWLGINVTVPFDTTLTDVNGIAQTEPSAGILAGLGSVTATLVSVPTEIVLFDATVEAGVAAAVAVQTPPTDGTAGVDLGGFSVRANDAFGNLATSFTGPVTLTAQLTDGTPVSVIVQGDNINAIGGIATFLTTRINTAGTYRLVADFGALGTVVTDSIVIEAADPSAIILVDGDGQSAGVTQSLASPLRVRVTDAFGNGIAGVNVNWGVISGLAEFSDTVAVTDGTGLAQTSAILGNTSGSISIGAFAAGLSGSPVTFTAVATAGTPFGLIAVSGGLQSAAAGTAFAQPFVVRVVDAFGNGVSGIEVTFDSPDGVSAFGDTVVTSDGSGLASTTAIAATTAGSSLIDASAPGVSPTSFGITITAGAAAALFNGALTLAGNAGDTYSPIDVSVLDAFGNTVTDFAGSVTIAVGVGPDGAVIGGTLTKPAVGGVVSFDDLVFTTAGNYSLAVTSDALPQINLPITINAATAATLAADGSPVRTGAAASTIAPPLAAKVTDAFGNPVSGAVVSWSIISGDITLSGPTSVTNALGVATIDVLAGPTAGSAEVTAASGSLSGSPVSFPITITNGPGTQLTMEIPPGGSIVGDFMPAFTVAIRDANGNVATDFVGDVTIVVDSGASPTIVGVATVAASGGAATFDQVTFETAGQYRLRFSSPGVTDVVSATFTMLPGAAANLALQDGDAQSDTVALTLDLPLRVRVTDAFGNAVSGQAVAWAPIGAGSVAQDTTLSDASGIAEVNFTLGTVSGSTSAQASVDGLTGSPVVFTADAIPGEVVALVVTSQPDTVVSGAVADPVTLEARDQYSNAVTWFTGNVTVTVNDAPAPNFASGTTTRAAVAGIATFDDLVFSNTGSWFVIFEMAGEINTNASFEIITGAPAAVTIVSGDNQSGPVTLQLPAPLVVRVADANNNPVVGDTVVFTVNSGGGTLGSLTALDSVLTNSNGEAQTTWTLGADTTVAQIVEANRTGFPTLTFNATPLPLVANITWTGDASTVSTDPANWSGAVLPTFADSVLVPSGRPNYPVLTADLQTARLTIENGANIELGQWSAFVNGSLAVLGAAQITSNDSGTVVLLGASGGTVRGTVPQLFVTAGNYTAVGDVNTALDMGVAGSGSLDFGSTISTVGRDLIVTGTGSIGMTAAPTVEVARDFLFASETITSGLTSGTLHIRGSFDATGNFRPSASHTTNFDGLGVQSVGFTTADESYSTSCVSGCFGTLISNKASGGLEFSSAIKAIGGLSVSGDTLGATGLAVIGVGTTELLSAVTTAGHVGYTTSLQVGAQFFADTLVAFGGNGATPPASVGTIPTRIEGAYALSANHEGSMLVVGVLDVDGPNARIGGDLVTAGLGHILMTDSADSLSVGAAQFDGATESAFLTAGVLEVRGNFVQNGADATTYAAESGHRLRMSGTTAFMQFEDALVNPIGTLHVSDGAALVINGLGARIDGDAVLEGTTAAVNAESSEVLIFGSLVDAIGNRWSVATTRFQGTNPSLPVAIDGSVIFADAATLSDSLIVAGVRVTTANGVLALNGHTVRATQFTTDDGGRLNMSNAADSLFVNGTAAFEGGTSTLTDGWMLVTGNFVQQVTGDAFAAGPEHETWLTGNSSVSVNFANAGFGAGQSHFGRLGISKEAGQTINLLSDVFVDGLWQAGDVNMNGDGGARLFTTRGSWIANVTFINVRWELLDGAGIIGNINGVSFGVMPDDVTQFRIARPSGTINLSGLNFSTSPSTGFFIEAEDTNTGDNDTLVVAIASVSPGTTNGRTSLLGGAQLTGWTSFALYTFTGATSSDFNDPSNWDVAEVPGSGANILVANESGSPLAIDSPIIVTELTMGPGATSIVVSEPVYTSGVLGGFDLVSGIKACSGNGAFVYNDPSPGPTFLRSTLANCDVVVLQGNVNLVGDFAEMQNLRIEGGFFNATSTVRVSGDLTMTNSGMLFTANPTDSLIVQGNASFRGAQASFTTGNIVVRGNVDVGADNPLQLRMESPSHLAVGDPLQSGGTRTISIDPGSQMYVDSLTVFDGTTTVSGTLRVRRRLTQATSGNNVLDGGTVEIGDPTNQIVGAMSSGLGGDIALDRIVVYGAIPLEGEFAPDTTDFVGTAPTDNGGIQKIRAANDQQVSHSYQLVRVFANATMDQVPTGIPFSYDIATGLHVLGGSLNIGDALTTDTVAVTMANGDLIVNGATAELDMNYPSRLSADSVHFQGGETSNLNSGILRTRSFVQRNLGAQTSTVVGSTPNVVEFVGTGTVSLENFAGNPLSDVRVQGNALTSLDSDLLTNGVLGRVTSDDGVVTLRSTTAATRTVYASNTAFGATNSGVVMRNVALYLQASFPEPGGAFALNNITFQQMDPLSTFITAAWAGVNNETWNNINFDSPVTATGRFFNFQSGNAGATITFTNASPAIGCLATVCVPSDFAPAVEPGATWFGGSSSSWSDPANWSTGTVPTAGTDVVIVGGVDFAPTVSANTGVRSLTVNVGATVLIDTNDTLSVYNDLVVNGTVAGASLGSTLRLVPPLDTFDLSATGDIGTRLAIGSGIGGFDGVVRLVDRVNLTATGFSSGVFLNAGLLDLNGNTLQTSSNFQTFGSARFKMTNPLDTILVGESFRTFGGSTDGLLTEGEIVLTGTLFRQYDDNSTTSFVATGNHSMRFGGGSRTLDVWFESPDSTLSRFANLAIDRTFDQWINFDYSRVFVTNLTKVSGRMEVYNDGFGVGLGSDGELIVTGSVSNVDPAHMFDMVQLGRVRLLAVNPATCDGLSFNVQYNQANFQPTICHSPDIAWAPETGTELVTSYGAYAASDTDIWVVGESGTIQRGDGSTWFTESSNTTNTLYALHGTSSSDVWAVGAAGTVAHWDGSVWTVTAQGSETLRGVFAFGPNEVYAVGDNGTILAFNGSGWNAMSSPTAVNLTSIYAQGPSSGDNNLLVTGANGTVLRLVSGSWGIENSNVAVNLNATYSSEASRYLVFGAAGTARRKFNIGNATYSAAVSPTLENLNGAGGNGTSGFVVGANGTILRLMGESLVLENSLISNELFGVTVTPNGTVYVAGANGLIHKGTIVP